MFLDQLRVDLHLYFDPKHEYNNMVEFDKLKFKIELNQYNKFNSLPPPVTFESVIIIRFLRCGSERRRRIERSFYVWKRMSPSLGYVVYTKREVEKIVFNKVMK
jgi:hypothetical protein